MLSRADIATPQQLKSAKASSAAAPAARRSSSPPRRGEGIEALLDACLALTSTEPTLEPAAQRFWERPRAPRRRPRPIRAGAGRERKSLAEHRRIVVKVGSSLLVDGATGKLDRDWLARLPTTSPRLAARRRDMLVVSSGAIALGRRALGARTRRAEA